MTDGKPAAASGSADSTASPLQAARVSGYRAEAQELLEGAASGAAPARRRRKTTTGPAESKAGETAEKPTRASRKNTTAIPPTKD